MERVLQRGVDTVERLRHFSRQAPETARSEADLNVLLREALEICGPRLRSQARAVPLQVKEELGDPPPVLVQASEVMNAILNLIVNAIDAMTAGGVITVRTGASAEAAFVQIEDNGPGIPAEMEGRIFEPFFTTKGREGTGLGLSMVYALMQRHGGRVTMDNRPGEGVRFTLWFPR
jgi:signal transduction histidine kinase